MKTQRIIKIAKNQIFLTPEMCLSLADTSLKQADLRFKEQQDIYFEIDIINYDKTNNSIEICVIDYEPKNIEEFKEQKPRGKVSFIKFLPLLWSRIEPYLSIYVKSKLVRDGIVYDNGSPLANPENTNSLTEPRRNNLIGITPASRMSTSKYDWNIPREPVIETITESGKIYFKDADFSTGFVAFSFKSKQLNQKLDLSISNPNILEEFNAIKSYFPKVFGGKKQFSINIVFTLKDKIVTDTITTSLEIESIDEKIIDSLKQQKIANLISTPSATSSGKLLFTSEDIFENFDDNNKSGNVFNQSEEEILNSLVQREGLRNATHLQFLSGKKQSSNQKLRFTLKPLFGFLFFIEGETKNHFCWELLNSHATYLWSFGNKAADVRSQFKRIEEAISIIKDFGREKYKRDFKTQNNDNDLSFSTIEHSNINSISKNSFVEWKHNLLEKIV